MAINALAWCHGRATPDAGDGGVRCPRWLAAMRGGFAAVRK